MTNAPLASSEAHNPPADSGLEPLRGLLAPRLWPSWLMLGVLRASALLPAGVALALCGTLLVCVPDFFSG